LFASPANGYYAAVSFVDVTQVMLDRGWVETKEKLVNHPCFTFFPDVKASAFFSLKHGYINPPLTVAFNWIFMGW